MTAPRWVVVVVFAVAVEACGGDTEDSRTSLAADTGGTGSSATGGATFGGSAGSVSTGGAWSGGSAGTASTGGAAGGAGTPATGGIAGGAGEVTCLAVTDGFGDCASVVGWAFDGTGCVLWSGCGCEPYCDRVFPTAAQCVSTCAEAGECNTAALAPAGIAGEFTPGAYCDEVVACASWFIESDLDRVLPLSSACESTSQCPVTMTCPAQVSGTLDAAAWSTVCAASLLPGVNLTCWVWGP